MKIIVVDDEQDVQFLFKQKFRKEIRTGQVEFHFSDSAAAALEYIEHQGLGDISLIISDINMPGMDGLQLLKFIKEKHQHFKIFMMTAYSDEQRQKAAQLYQADDYLTKPVDFEQLKTKIFDVKALPSI